MSGAYGGDGFRFWNPTTWSWFRSRVPEIQLLRLTPEARAEIWNWLDQDDIGSLRSVSKIFRADIDTRFGIFATLNGSWSLVPSASPGPPGSPATNLEWISSVAVRSLSIRRLDDLTFDPPSLLKQPEILRKLSLDLSRKEFDGPRTAMLRGLLDFVADLRSLEVKQALHDGVLFLEPYSPALDSHVNLRELVSASLETCAAKPKLKELVVQVNFYDPDRSRGFRLVRELNFRPDLEFDLKLLVLRLRLPFLSSREELLGWKKLLDAQDRLRVVELNLGWLHWDFVSDLLLASARSLKELRLPLIDQAFLVSNYEPEPSPESLVKLFSWSVLWGSSLEVIQVWSMDRQRILRTLNFSALDLKNVHELELGLIQLSELEMMQIFVQGLELRSLKLVCWTPDPEPGKADGSLLSKINVAVLVAITLPAGRLEEAVLEDYSLVCRPFDMVNTLGGVAELAGYDVGWEEKQRIFPRAGSVAILTLSRQ